MNRRVAVTKVDASSSAGNVTQSYRVRGGPTVIAPQSGGSPGPCASAAPSRWEGATHPLVPGAGTTADDGDARGRKVRSEGSDSVPVSGVNPSWRKRRDTISRGTSCTYGRTRNWWANSWNSRARLACGRSPVGLQKESIQAPVRGSYRCTRTRPVAPRMRMANWEPSRPRT